MEETKVKHLMIPIGQYACISRHATLYEAAVALEEARNKRQDGAYPYLAVLCDKTSRVIGVVSLLELLKSLEPKKGAMADSRKANGHGLAAEFLRSTVNAYDLWKTPLEELCRKAAQMNVGMITKSPLDGECIDAEASLNRAVQQFVMGHHQSLLVSSEGEIVGILRLTDVSFEVGDQIKACCA